eukprot:141527-Hanusia_phi.AAC.1
MTSNNLHRRGNPTGPGGCRHLTLGPAEAAESTAWQFLKVGDALHNLVYRLDDVPNGISLGHSKSSLVLQDPQLAITDDSPPEYGGPTMERKEYGGPTMERNGRQWTGGRGGAARVAPRL